MDATLKAKWVEALRSGKYRQGAGQLYEPQTESHCCLGVLSRIANLPIDENGYSPDGYDRFSDLLGEDTTEILWRMNDGGGKTFSKIADYIEKHL